MVSARFCLSFYPLAVLAQEYWGHDTMHEQVLPDPGYGQVMPDFGFDPYMQPQPVMDMPMVDPSCQAEQMRHYEESGLPALNIGQVHCAQAGDGRWWDITILHHGCDGTYAAQVKDEALTFWPIVHRSLVLDESCKIYEAMAMELQAEKLAEQGQDAETPDSEEPSQDAPAQDSEPSQDAPAQGSPDLPPSDATDLPPRDASDLPPRVEQEQVQVADKPNMPVAAPAKKVPWRVVGAAASAGAVPLIFGLTGAASGAAV